MAKPAPELIPEFYRPYIEALPNDLGLLNQLAQSGKEFVNLLKGLPESKATHRYEEGKWSIKEVVLHVSDAERVFAYRALAFARGDKTDLPGFDQDAYVAHSHANERSLEELVIEFEDIRKSSVDLFRSFNRDQLNKKGTANNNEVTVKVIGYIMAGHQVHHIRILNERYLH